MVKIMDHPSAKSNRYSDHDLHNALQFSTAFDLIAEKIADLVFNISHFFSQRVEVLALSGGGLADHDGIFLI